MSKLRILLADDHEIFRAGLKALVDAQPDLQVIGEAASGEEAVAKATALEPDLVLMDIAMPGISGIEATRRIRSARPRIQVLALTAHDSPEYFFTMLQAEAAGYVLKEASPGELFAAIRAAQRGEAYFYPSVARRLLNDYLRRVRSGEEKESYDGLSPREREVLKLIAQGYTNREIAQTLIISVNTVEAHRSRLMQKLNLHNRAQLVKYAIRSGLIEVEREPIP
ncbi:MAG TPA: response regulator transcription factor [Dehalococcoidia bacterium]|nr:response regulator transcription factor [Dehalococcoidia bacterium]